MEIDRIILNGKEFYLDGLEKYLIPVKKDYIVSQEHKAVISFKNLMDWYNNPKPDYYYFTYDTSNPNIHLYTSRGNSCPSKMVFSLDCVERGMDMDRFRELNEWDRDFTPNDDDTITIYYGN